MIRDLIISGIVLVGIVAAFALRSQPAHPEWQSIEPGTSISAPEVRHLSIYMGEDHMVTLGIDGSIEYGPDYNPDQTAIAFWQFIASRAPCKE